MKKIIVGIGILLCVAVGILSFGMWFLFEAESTYYYTQIDNGKAEQINSRGGVIDLHGGMSYSYTLLAYSENDDEKNITFGTSKELTEGAFIRLTVVPIRGVIEWSEMQYDELPAAVQREYENPGGEQR